MIAAGRGHSSIVAELVRAGAQIDAQDQVYIAAYMALCVCVCVCVFGFLINYNMCLLKLQKSKICNCATKSQIIMSITIDTNKIQ